MSPKVLHFAALVGATFGSKTYFLLEDNTLEDDEEGIGVVLRSFDEEYASDRISST